MKIKIDHEFRDRIPTADDDELEAVLIRDGCRDALVLWEEKGLLIDGHRRHSICSKHGIGFRTINKSFPDREAVLEWIDENAAARRNLLPDQLSLIRGRVYNARKKHQGGTGANQHAQRDQSDPSAKTADHLAAEHDVSAPTIKRDGAFAAAVEKVKAIEPEIEKQIATGEAPAKSTIIKAAKAETKKEAKAILAGKPVAEPPPRKNGSEVVSAKDRKLAAKLYGQLKRLMAGWPGHNQLRPSFEAIAIAIDPAGTTGRAA